MTIETGRATVLATPGASDAKNNLVEQLQCTAVPMDCQTPPGSNMSPAADCTIGTSDGQMTIDKALQGSTDFYMPNDTDQRRHTPQELNSLFQAAQDAPASTRAEPLGQLAKALAAEDVMTIGHYAAQVKANGLANKGEFMQAVRSAAETPRHNKRGPTHDELRDRWLATHRDFAYGIGDWRRYAEGVWFLVSDDVIRSELELIIEQAKPEGIRPASHVLNSVYELARVKCAIPGDRWDADPDILVCRNGTLHIPSRTLREHSLEDYATSGLSFDYDPTASCPSFLRAIRSTVPEVEGFLQEFAGLCLTTSTRYELALWLFGPRGSGKSTVLLGLQTMLGTRTGVLGLADIERSSFALTNLPGKTLLVATEQPAGFVRSAHILNALISGESIPVDRKYRDPVVITPCAKIAWAMNELPRIAETSSGLFRRVKVVKFPELLASQRDPDLKEAIATEGAGILNWALDGLARLNDRKRFDIPHCVQDATADFERQNDVPALFVAECCHIGGQYSTQSQVLYNAYQAWCAANGHKPQSSTSVANEWQRLRFERYRAGGKTFWRGVGLIDTIGM